MPQPAGPNSASAWTGQRGQRSIQSTASRLPDLPAGFGSGTNPTHPYAAVIEETHLFSSNLVNEGRFGFIHDSFGYTPPFNMTGQPSLSLPMGMSSHGLPIGMMFTGRYSDEATLYRLAAQIEEARAWQPWATRKPQVWG